MALSGFVFILLMLGVAARSHRAHPDGVDGEPDNEPVDDRTSVA
jgi:hypothetical protein